MNSSVVLYPLCGMMATAGRCSLDGPGYGTGFLVSATAIGGEKSGVSELGPLAESVRLRVGAMNLRCLLWGRPGDPPVVLVHGAAAHAHWWDVLLPRLLPGWRLIAPDLRGHGESDWAEPPYLIEHFYEDLRGLLDVLVPPPRPVVLIGHSMGGRVAAWYAVHHPERVRGLALLDARMAELKPGKVDQWRGAGVGKGPRRSYATRAEALAAFRLIPAEPGVEAAVMAALAEHAVGERAPGQWALRFDREVLSLEASRLAGVLDMLPKIRCPTLVLKGAESSVTSEQECAALAAAVDDCTVSVLPGGHHFLLAHPAAVGAALCRFLERVDREGRHPGF